MRYAARGRLGISPELLLRPLLHATAERSCIFTCSRRCLSWWGCDFAVRGGWAWRRVVIVPVLTDGGQTQRDRQHETGRCHPPRVGLAGHWIAPRSRFFLYYSLRILLIGIDLRLHLQIVE